MHPVMLQLGLQLEDAHRSAEIDDETAKAKV